MAEREQEREWDGKYAPSNSAQDLPKVRRKRGRPKGSGKGQARTPGSGRKKGTPNKATREWRQFCIDMVNDPVYQGAMRKRVLDRPEIGLRVAEFAVGRPTESVDVNLKMSGEIVARLIEARKRLSGDSGE